MADISDIEQMEREMDEVETEDQLLRRHTVITRKLRMFGRLFPIVPATAFAVYVMMRGNFSVALSSYTAQEKAVGVALLGGMTFLKAYIEGRIREIKDDDSIILARRRVHDQMPDAKTPNAEDAYFDNLVKINVENLAAYYELVKIQTDKSFRASLGIAYFGAGLIVTGLAIGFFRTDSADKITYISTGAGVLTEFIAGVFFWLYSRTVSQLRGYHDSLISVQNVLLSFKLVSDTQDPKDKAEMVSKMCSYLMTSLSKQVAEASKAAPRKPAAAAKRKAASASNVEE
jgi:hypothetical protein